MSNEQQWTSPFIIMFNPYLLHCVSMLLEALFASLGFYWSDFDATKHVYNGQWYSGFVIVF